MGKQEEGTPMTWAEIRNHRDDVKRQGIQQFISIYNKWKDRDNDPFLFGDEIEYFIVKVDESNKRTQLSLRSKEILNKTDAREKQDPQNQEVLWRPETALYQIEATPGQPYKWDDTDMHQVFASVQANMSKRRRDIKSFLPKDEDIMSITAFPRIGCPEYTDPVLEPDPRNSSGSHCPPHESCLCNMRYISVFNAISERRGGVVSIHAPILMDENTMSPFVDQAVMDERFEHLVKPGHVFMDSSQYGMPLNCLQVTMQASNMRQCMHLYDQLANVCPIALALTAATVANKGFLLDTDCRFDIVAQAADCRNAYERGEGDSDSNGHLRIPKQRYASIDSYLTKANAKYNDTDAVHHEQHYGMLKDAGIGEEVARHVAHLFIRDPLVLIRENLVQDPEKDTSHFMNIQSTNWQTLRFKPPDSAECGWRVEFRPMEVQVTDFENSAFVCFIVLLAKAITEMDVNLVVPISYMEQNMAYAEERDAARSGKFWFRKNILVEGKSEPDDEFIFATLDEIVNGSDRFLGLIPLIRKFLARKPKANSESVIDEFCDFVSGRASGKIPTNAQWIRNILQTHPDYQRDSVVTESMNFDLINRLMRVSKEAAISHSPSAAALS